MPGETTRVRAGVAAAALAVLIAAVIALSIGSVRLDSATSDEPAHIANGMVKLQERAVNFFREQPPLMNSFSAVPLVLAGYRIGPQWKTSDHWVAGRRFLYRSGYNAYRILFLARLPTIVLFAVLCIVVYWFVFRETGSAWWALAAAGLTGFCPNVMAHGRLATVDLALTLFAFTASALLLRLIDAPSILTGVLCGLATIAAVMSKVSGVILAPYFVIVIAAALVTKRIADRKRFFTALAIGALAGFAFFEIFMRAVGSTGPIADYEANIDAIRHWYAQGNALPAFFLGRYSYGSWPAYYPVAFLLKTTIPALLLLVLAIVVARKGPRFTLGALFGFVALFFAFAITGHLALGIRYILPVYPFVYAATAIALRSQTTRAFTIAVVVLLAWHAGENLRAYPGYIGYFNELIGSNANADKFLIDSNLDWGQDLRRLELWMTERKIPQIAIHYFGGGDVGYDLAPARVMVLYSPPAFRLPDGYFAVSRHFYRLSFDPQVFGVDYDTVIAANHGRYVTTIGDSILVYRVGR